MGKISQIFNEFYPAYFQKFGQLMPLAQTPVANALLKCRTGHYGYTEISCGDCKSSKLIENGCGNRHCPQCQQEKNALWAEKQVAMLVPNVPYFMVTFTIPEGIRPFFQSNPRLCYDALFEAASETIKGLLRNKKYLGAEHVGFFGVLHTWDRQMNYHPHIHFIVPGIGLSKDMKQMFTSAKDFLFYVPLASQIVRAKFKDIIVKNGFEKQYLQLPYKSRHEGWNVNSQSVGSGKEAIYYLSRYVFKTAISEDRILNSNSQSVTFQYKKKGTNRIRKSTVSGEEFIRRFLLHVLPRGLKKVRHYGFLNSKSKTTRGKLLFLILETVVYLVLPDPAPKKKKPKQYTCIKCHSHNVTCKWLKPIFGKVKDTG